MEMIHEWDEVGGNAQCPSIQRTTSFSITENSYSSLQISSFQQLRLQWDSNVIFFNEFWFFVW